MKNFEYSSPGILSEVSGQLSNKGEDVAILAGGTDLIGEMKAGIVAPRQVMNIKRVRDLHFIKSSRRNLQIGTLTKISELLSNPEIERDYPLLAEAARSVATPQIRNMGTVGGNLCQRPRCWYYRSHLFPCLKKGGAECYAHEGENAYHAILGGGPCYIVHPSDLAPALMALNANVTIQKEDKDRTIPLEDFYVLPDDRLERETVLEPNELLTEIIIPASRKGIRSTYIKIREKEAFDFALVSLALTVQMKNGRCWDARVVYGGVAPRPWRSRAAEKVLKGHKLTENTARKAGEAAMVEAEPLSQNRYKVILAKNILVKGIRKLG